MTPLLLVAALFLFCAETAAVDCPSGWVAHAQKCYHFSHDKEYWTGARFICQSYGADLVAIESSGENAFLRNEVNRMSGEFWLGGNDFIEEGVWVWAASGASLAEYSNWNSGEPNNAGGNENCLLMAANSHGWNDGDCSVSLFKYICEKDPGSTAPVVG